MKQIKKFRVIVYNPRFQCLPFEYTIIYSEWLKFLDENRLESGFESLSKFFLKKLGVRLEREFTQIEYLY